MNLREQYAKETNQYYYETMGFEKSNKYVEWLEKKLQEPKPIPVGERILCDDKIRYVISSDVGGHLDKVLIGNLPLSKSSTMEYKTILVNKSQIKPL